MGYSGYSGYSGTNARIGGVWKFDKIISPSTGNNYFHGIQAKKNKIWWLYAEDAFEQLVETINDITCAFAGVAYSKYEQAPITPPGQPERLYSESWDDDRLGGAGTVTVSGGVGLAPNPNYKGEQAGGVFNYPLIPAYQGYDALTYPFCLSGNITSWSFRYDPVVDNNTQNHGFMRINSLSNGYSVMPAIDIFPAAIFYREGATYGHWQHFGPDIDDVWIDDKKNALFFEGLQGFPLGSVISFLDFPYGDIDNPCIGYMTRYDLDYYGFNYMYEKIVGNVTWRIGVDGCNAWLTKGYFFMSRTEVGSTARPSATIPLELTIRESRGGNLKSYKIFGGSEPSAFYTYKQIITLDA